MRIRNEPSYQQQSRIDRKNGKNEPEMFGEKEIKERKTPIIFPKELFISQCFPEVFRSHVPQNLQRDLRCPFSPIIYLRQQMCKFSSELF